MHKWQKQYLAQKLLILQKLADSPESSSGANKPTIGETSIFTQEAGRIRKEVHTVMHEQFAEGRVQH